MLTTLPNAIILQQAHYVRVGNDLQLKTAQDTITIENYFNNPFLLTTADGQQITVEEVAAQLNSGTNLGEIIGYVTTLVNGPVSAESTNGQIRTLQVGDPVYLQETLLTAPQSYIKITLNDNSIFQLGPLSKAQLNQYSYDPQMPEAGGHLAGDIFIGIFRFISGQISNEQGERHTTFNTPSATIGIRGSEIDARVDSDGATTVLHTTGLIEITSHYSDSLLSIYEPNTLVYIPITPLLPTVQLATQEQIIQIRGQLTPLNSSNPQEILHKSEITSDSSAVGPHDEGGRVYPDQSDSVDKKDSLGQQASSANKDSDFDSQKIAEMSNVENKLTPTHTNIPQELPPNDVTIPSKFILFEDNSLIIESHLAKGSLLDISQPLHGSVINNWDGSLTYTPQWGYLGKDYFQFHQVEELAALQIVAPIGYAKTGNSLTLFATTEKDDAISYQITQQDANTYQVEVTISTQLINLPALGQGIEYTQPLYGQLQIQTDGQLRYLPPENFHGTDSFTYRISPEADFMTVEFQIAPVNDPPIANNDSDIVIAEDTLLTLLPVQLLSNDTDADNDGLSIVSVNTLPNITGESTDLTHGSVFFDDSANKITFIPTQDYFGTAQFSYTVVDFQGARSTATVTVNITPVNDAPEAQDDQIAIKTSEPISIAINTLLANDSDVENEPLRLIRVENAQNGTVKLNDNHDIIFTPADHFRQGSFNYVITDEVIDTETGQLTETKAIVYINTAFNHELTKAYDDTIFIDKEVSFKIATHTLLANDVGQNGLTVTAVNNGQNGNVTLEGDYVIFTRDEQFINSGNFTYTVTDGTTVATAQVIVNGTEIINQAPIAQNDIFYLNPQASYIFTTHDLLNNDTDADGDTVGLVALNETINGSVVLNSDDTLIFTPNDAYGTTGTAAFAYTIEDFHGNTAQAVVELVLNATVTAQNDALPIFSNAPQSIEINRLLSNDVSSDNSPLHLVTVQDAYQGEVMITGDYVLFTPSDSLNCSINSAAGFSYTVENADGFSTTAQVYLTASPMPPLVQADEITVKDNAPLIIEANHLLANDTDPYSQNLTLTAVNDAIGGTVKLQENNTVLFTPSDEFITTHLGGFSYTVSNGCDTALTTVTVRNDNMPPVAQNDNLIIKGVDATEISQATLLSNDSDENSDILHISDVANAISGTVQLTDTNNILFTPNAEFVNTGVGGFMYTISDAHGNVDTAIVSLSPDNRPPIAQNDSFNITIDSATIITPEQLLANDSDVDSDILTITDVSEAIGGTVELLDNGQIQFTPNDDLSIAKIGGFTYMINDMHGGTDTAIVTLVYENPPPEANNDHFDIATDAPTLITVESLLSNDSDPNNEALNVILVNQAVNGKVKLIDDSYIQFTPNDAFIATGEFSYTITDIANNQASAIVTLSAINNPPIAVADEFLLTENAAFNININELLANDSDPEQGDLSVIKVSNAMNGEVVLNTDQTVTFTPNETFNQVGVASFVYMIADEAGNEAMTTVQLILDLPQVIFATNDVVTVPNSDPAVIPSEQLLINDIGNELSIISFSRNVINGSVALTAEGDVLFTPKAQFAIDRAGAFSYVISDGEQTANALVELRIGTNISPTGSDDTISIMPETLSVAITHESLLSNDIDIDGDSLEIILVKSAQNGFVQTLTDEVIFFPDAQFSATGQGSFQYVVADGKGGIDTVTVNIAQEIKAAEPIAQSDTIAATLNQAELIAQSSLLANDLGEQLSITAVNSTNPAINVSLDNADVRLFIDALLVDDFNKLSFDYTVINNQGLTSQAIVNIEPNNLTPIADNITENSVQDEVIVGTANADHFAQPIGHDILLGQAGDDTFIMQTDLNGQKIDGQQGIDSLLLDGNNLVLDFSSLANNQSIIQGIEKINLAEGVNNQISLRIADVLDLSDNETLIIEGNDTSIVRSEAQGWEPPTSVEINNLLYNSYVNGNAELLVSADIQNQFIS